ncbi:MAG: hypothetical protein GQ574_19550 [Crocinitomix sp.]|nr:hypothetical protein [Crocinitomix sp.]
MPNFFQPLIFHIMLMRKTRIFHLSRQIKRKDKKETKKQQFHRSITRPLIYGLNCSKT